LRSEKQAVPARDKDDAYRAYKVEFNRAWPQRIATPEELGGKPEFVGTTPLQSRQRHVMGGFDACNGGIDDCCSGHAGPGCDDLVCCTTICNEDPFCCDEAWDDACADIAGDLCGVCGGGTGDECSGCIPVIANSQYVGSSDGATGTNESSCAGADDTNDMWHCWVSECVGEATISLCGGSDFDTSLAVFENGCNGAEVACNDDACPGLLSELTVDVTPGTLYAIRVAGFGGQTGNYTLDISCEIPIEGCIDAGGECCAENGSAGCDDPVCCQSVCNLDPFCCDSEWDESCADLATTACACNDSCEDAGDIFDGVTDFSNVGATTDGPAELDCDGLADNVENDVWFDYISSCSGDLIVDTCGTAFDTVVAVYDGCECPVGQPSLGCDDDSCDTGLQSEVVLGDVVEGNCYKIRVGSFSDAVNDVGTINIFCDADIPACIDGSGDCCSGHGGVGCESPGCCDLVCTQDAFCCDGEWDEACADLAGEECFECGGGNGDFCEGCLPVVANVPLAGSTADATGENESSCAGTGDINDIWHCWTSECAGQATISLCDGSDFDTSLAVYDASGGCGGAELACNDDACPGLLSELTMPVEFGNEYLIRVAGFGGQTGNYNLNIDCTVLNEACIDADGDCLSANGSPGCDSTTCCAEICAEDPFCCDSEWDESCADLALVTFACNSNDACPDAFPVEDGATPFSNVGAATDGPAEPTCNGAADDVENDVWYDYIATCTGDLLVDTCGTGFDTALAAYEGCDCPVSAPGLACDDDDCDTGLQSMIEFDVAEGNCYKIRVGSFSAAADGEGTLNIFCDADIPACIDGVGDCLEAHDGPGCDSPNCCDQICTQDPFCCDEVWDESCADLALVTFACNSNDACQDSFEILDGTTDFTNVGASTDGPLELGCDGAADDVENDVWYDYTATCTGVLTADTCGTDFDTALAVYDGCDCPAVAPGLGCDDDACDTGLQSLVIVDGVVEGNCYKVRVGSFSAAADGEGIVNINCEPYIEECIDGVGDCCEAHGNGGCNDTACCNLVCEQDAFCCEGEWDEACADLSGQVCIACGGTIPECVGTGGDCCEANGTPGCDNGSCCADICTADPFCCATTWDQLCADAANIDCAVCIAPEICFESSDPCLEPHDLPACEIPACCGEVCNEDTFCCDVEWDEACVDIASDIASCQGGGGNENDNCADAEPVTAGTTFYDSTGMTDDGPELPEECDEGFGLGFGSDLWYAYTAGDCGAVTLSLCEDTAYDSRMAVYEGCGCPTSNDALAGCDDDGCGTTGGPSSITLDAVAGTCYLVRIGGFNGAAGTGALQVTEDFTGCSACPDGDVTWMTPVDGVVDARQPHPVGSLEPQQGIDTFDVAAPSGAAEECWSMCETSDGGLGANSIVSAIDNGDDTYTLTLSRPITAGQVTTITYNEAVTGTFTSHPSNVNGDGAAGPLDILAIIDYLNAVDVSPFGTFSEDIDQSGLLTPTDILAVIDLLNGADTHDVWNNTNLPENTNCP
jgi:hypothetical protein